MIREEIDLDATSQSHVYRALRRAESDYGSYTRCLHASKKKYLDSCIENERHRSRTAFTTSRIFCCDNSKLVKTVRTVTSEEIKSSVNRSRRWSGKDCKAIKQNRHLSTQTLKLKTKTELKVKQNQNLSKQHQASAEDVYHKTVCNILTGQGTKSSYGHVAKVMTRKSNIRNTTFDTKLPVVNHRNDRLICQDTPSVTNKHSSKRHLDVTLPSVLRSAARKTRSNDYKNPYIVAEDTSSEQSHKKRLFFQGVPNHLNLTNICHVLSDGEFDSLQEKMKDKDKLMMSLKKKQAQRAITRYYNQKQEIEDQNRMVIIHLPNPNVSLESLQMSKRTPRLLLRNITQSNDHSLSTDNENFKEKKPVADTSLPNSLSRINIRPFVTNAGCSKPTNI